MTNLLLDKRRYTMKTILVPTDFSEKADYALDTACHIARKSESKVILLHVIEGVSHSTFSATGEMSFSSEEEQFFTLKLIEKAKQQLEERKNYSNSEGLTIDYELRVGNAYTGIKGIITNDDVDLIVMGTSGAHGFDEMLLGSTTEKVVRYAKSSVLTIHRKQEVFNYKNIVFASGLNENEEAIINVLKIFQNIYDAQIHLVRINTPNNFERDTDTLAAMKSFAESSGLKNYTMNVFNDTTEEEGIIYFSEHIKADLISLSTHGRTGLAHLLSGSIAEDVVSHANRPVLTHVID